MKVALQAVERPDVAWRLRVFEGLHQAADLHRQRIGGRAAEHLECSGPQVRVDANQRLRFDAGRAVG